MSENLQSLHHRSEFLPKTCTFWTENCAHFYTCLFFVFFLRKRRYLYLFKIVSVLTKGHSLRTYLEKISITSIKTEKRCFYFLKSCVTFRVQVVTSCRPSHKVFINRGGFGQRPIPTQWLPTVRRPNAIWPSSGILVPLISITNWGICAVQARRNDSCPKMLRHCFYKKVYLSHYLCSSPEKNMSNVHDL